MFTVNQQANRIARVKKMTFTELGFSERNHLQEWLANEPSALGEELLIIQKEFDGFDDTRERLDLLALDKKGNLVIIENKLDDSGRDVVWQAVKYAAYCATLTKQQIVKIYQDYLQKNIRDESARDAAESICDFLSVSNLDEIKINSGNSQRIMLVAAKFRKEVTSTALWLLDHGIEITCFKVTPYLVDEKPLINIEQVIPTPDTEELMVKIRAKEAEEKNTEVVANNIQLLRRSYWEKILSVFQPSECDLYNNINPSKDHWLSAGSGFSSCPYSLIFNTDEIRVQIEFTRSKEENKFIFDFFFDKKEEIENAFGEQLDWLRLDEKKSSRIEFSFKANTNDKDAWDEYANWHLEHMIKLEKAFKVPLQQASQALKNNNMDR